MIGGGASVSSESEGFVNDSGPTSDRNGWTATGFSSQHHHDDDGHGNLHRCGVCRRIARKSGLPFWKGDLDGR